VLKYFPTHLQAIRDLLLHCTSELQSTSIRFLKIDVLQDVPFTSKSFLSFLNSSGSIRLKRNDWRKMKELNLQL